LESPGFSRGEHVNADRGMITVQEIREALDEIEATSIAPLWDGVL